MRAEKQKGSFFSFDFVSWCLMWKITWINISNARKHWEKYLPNTTSCACWNETFCQNHHLSAPQDLSTHVKGKEKMCNFLSDLSSQFSVPVENFRSQSVPIFPIRPPVEKFMWSCPSCLLRWAAKEEVKRVLSLSLNHNFISRPPFIGGIGDRFESFYANHCVLSFFNVIDCGCVVWWCGVGCVV